MPEPITGVLDLLPRGGGFLRDPARSFQPGPDDPFVPSALIRKLHLAQGATLTVTARPGKKSPQTEKVLQICGMAPEALRECKPFTDLTVINPEDRFRLGKGGNVSMRLVELVAPIARGTRGLIVAPPRTGKTRLLEELAVAVHEDAPDTRVVVLLVDERPEEVTHFRRQVPAEVLASSNDRGAASHVRLVELAMAQIRCELECGHDVVVLVDSITRMARAYNQHGSGSGRVMTGGLDSRAMETPRKFFGMARNIEGGGSVTVVATALVETGSRMDDLIFEEFKGTGNMELVLDRRLAEQRIFPAIDLRASGTRREDLLFDEDELPAVDILRRGAAAVDTRQALVGVLELMQKWPTNEELLRNLRA